MLSADGLQKLILGSGMVYWYDDPVVHSELAYDWGKDAERYQCAPDSIRVYLSGLFISDWSDWKRHRYFPLAKYQGAESELLGIISQSIFRITSRNVQDDHITDFESLYLYQQKRRLIKLREAAASVPRSHEEAQYLTALEEENTQALGQLRTLQSALSTEEEKCLFLELQLEEVQAQLKASQEQFSSFSITEAQYKRTIGEQDDKRQFCRHLPKTLAQDLHYIAELFPDKIIVLDAAFESAENAKFQSIPEANELLYEMATTLHRLFFFEDESNIEGAFKLTGFELTMKESSATKANKRLMDLRKRNYDGKDEYFSPHTKLEKGGKDLRVHFIADQTKKLLVIGHCGDHLETAGTARRKEG
jgi:hypothetical protein